MVDDAEKAEWDKEDRWTKKEILKIGARFELAQRMADEATKAAQLLRVRTRKADGRTLPESEGVFLECRDYGNFVPGEYDK